MSLELPNLRHMRVFLEAARSGSISIAAERSNLSQPAATQAIARLESELGTQLLMRRSRRSVPTETGDLFIPRVDAALAFLSDGAHNAARIGGSTRRRTDGFDRNVTAAHLRTLVAVANSGSFTVAARELGLSQPTVHRSARALEDIAGIEFFVVSPSGVALTRAARSFVRGAKLAQAEIKQGIDEINRAEGKHAGSIRLGSLPLARTSIVPHATNALIAEMNGVQVRVVDGRYGELLRSLREGDLDCLIGALRQPPPADDVTEETLFHDDLTIVAHPSHPLHRREGLCVEDTLAYPWVAPPKDTPAGQYLFETLRIHEREQTPVRVVSSSLVMLRGILALGEYVSIISRHQISVEEDTGHILPLNIPLDGGKRAIGLTYRHNWRPTETQSRFMTHLRTFSDPSASPAPRPTQNPLQ